MKRILWCICVLLLFSCGNIENDNQTAISDLPVEEQQNQIQEVLDEWHKAAAKANYQEYFDLMAAESHFIGTDATENWSKMQFMEWSRPYFESGKAWDFTALDRNIYFAPENDLVWFDELLETQMGLCRGSGVLKKEAGLWKIKHYVLSMTIPNDKVEEAIKLKKEGESKVSLNFR